MSKWTRRRFLETVGRVGGAAAVYESMVALGMVRVPDSVYADPLQIPDGAGSGKTIVILAAGIALQQAGVIEQGMPRPASAVSVISPADGKPTRVAYRFDDQGNKVRICARTKVDL